MGWRGNSYDSAKAESFMKTLSGGCLSKADEAFEAVAEDLPRLIEKIYNSPGPTRPSAI
jgi:putative transposase